MAGDTLATRRQRLAELIGFPRSQTIPDDLKNQLNSYVEDALYYICRYHDWDFLAGYELVETQARYATGTITVASNALTTVTGNYTSWDATWPTGAKIRVDGNLYRVATIAGAGSITMTDAFLAGLTASQYELYLDRYTLATVQDIRSAAFSAGGNDALRPIAQEQMYSLKSNSFRFGRPEFWSIAGYSGDYPIIELWPIPDINVTLSIVGRKAITIPSSDSSTDDVPAPWSNVVDQWAKVFMYEAVEDARYGPALDMAQASLALMLGQADPNKGSSELVLDPRYYGG